MKTDKWTNQIDKTTNDFVQAFGSLADEQLNWKPDGKTWSIAQNIDHLIVINESYYPILDSIRKGEYKTPFIGKFGFMVNFLGKALLKAVDPGRKKKSKTFPIWKPSQDKMLVGVLEKFEKHQEGLKSQIEQSEYLLEKGTVISSPANKNIVYKLETAFDIITTHEQRHFNQAKEVLEKMST
jgi:hypothetical protein